MSHVHVEEGTDSVGLWSLLATEIVDPDAGIDQNYLSVLILQDRSASMVALANITHRDPNILSGSLVFVGTRVPVRSLFDYLEGGESLDEFLHQFPSVTREFAIGVLEAAYEAVAADAKYL